MELLVRFAEQLGPWLCGGRYVFPPPVAPALQARGTDGNPLAGVKMQDIGVAAAVGEWKTERCGLRGAKEVHLFRYDRKRLQYAQGAREDDILGADPDIQRANADLVGDEMERLDRAVVKSGTVRSICRVHDCPVAFL